LRVNIHEPIGLINIEGDFSFAKPIPNKWHHFNKWRIYLFFFIYLFLVFYIYPYY
jgi:hypothetical protein